MGRGACSASSTARLVTAVRAGVQGASAAAPAMCALCKDSRALRQASHRPPGAPLPRPFTFSEGDALNKHAVIHRLARLQSGAARRHLTHPLRGLPPATRRPSMHGPEPTRACCRPTASLAAHLQLLQQVPADGLALAVRVGGQQHSRRTLRRRLDGRHAWRGRLAQLPLHLEALLGHHRPRLGGQVPHMTIARQHLLAWQGQQGHSMGSDPCPTQLARTPWASNGRCRHGLLPPLQPAPASSP